MNRERFEWVPLSEWKRHPTCPECHAPCNWDTIKQRWQCLDFSDHWFVFADSPPGLPETVLDVRKRPRGIDA